MKKKIIKNKGNQLFFFNFDLELIFDVSYKYFKLNDLLRSGF